LERSNIRATSSTPWSLFQVRRCVCCTMKFLALFTTALLSSIVIADPLFDEKVFEIFSINTTRSSVPQILSGAGGLAPFKRATCAGTTCSNGGCCDAGGPCTTDGMCCLSGEFACSDGGCCANGATCATVDGVQVCQSTVSCTAPVVICGSACCDAGTECVTVGTQFRCEPGNGSTPTTTSQASGPTPELGDGQKNTTISRLTTPTYDLSSVSATSGIGASSAKGGETTSATAITLTAGAQASPSSSSSSSKSASAPTIYVSDMRFVFSILGAVFLGAAFMLIN